MFKCAVFVKGSGHMKILETFFTYFCKAKSGFLGNYWNDRNFWQMNNKIFQFTIKSSDKIVTLSEGWKVEGGPPTKCPNQKPIHSSGPQNRDCLSVFDQMRRGMKHCWMWRHSGTNERLKDPAHYVCPLVELGKSSKDVQRLCQPGARLHWLPAQQAFVGWSQQSFVFEFLRSKQNICISIVM